MFSHKPRILISQITELIIHLGIKIWKKNKKPQRRLYSFAPLRKAPSVILKPLQIKLNRTMHLSRMTCYLVNDGKMSVWIKDERGHCRKAMTWLTLKDPMPGSPVLVALLEAAGAGAPLSLASVPWLEADLAVWDMARGFRRVRVWGGGRQGDEQK